MRRSSAPSQSQPLAKRPKFQTAFNNNTVLQTQKSLNVPSSEVRCPAGTQFSGSFSLSCNTGVKNSPGNVTKKTDGFKPPTSKMCGVEKQGSSMAFHRPPLSSVTGQPPATNQVPVNNTYPSHDTTYGYFSVMWCKASKKKHKKWEGDAVLVTHGRIAQLYDMESKEIGKATGYKATELSSLKEDETLFIGGKEIQVMSVISEENYKSGKCFMSDSTPVVTAEPKTAPLKFVPKPFVNPCKENGGGKTSHNQGGFNLVECSSRFDPTAPGALVMARPSPSHQWEHNKKELAVVDVVVDPYIAHHLRPHQREGISFLYECVMGMRNYKGYGAILADDMGLGKTLQCISLLWTLLKQGPYGGKPVIQRVIIITPGSLVKNWKQEFKKWLGSERVNVFAVGQDNRVENHSETVIETVQVLRNASSEDFVRTVSPIMIISYEMFVRSAEQLHSQNFDIVICDEGHRLKNTTIKTTALIMSLSTRKRVVLSGTPIQNDLQEFFSIVEFVNPGVLGSMSAFRAVYEDPIVRAREPSATPEDIEMGEKRAGELARLTKLFVLRRTQDINNKYLLPKVDIVVFCQAGPLQLNLYRKLLGSRLIRSCLSGHYSGSPHLVCISALKKLCNHPALLYNNARDAEAAKSEVDEETMSIYNDLLPVYPVNFDPCQPLIEDSGKLLTLAALLWSLYSEGPRERVVLVSNHTKTLDLLQQFCGDQGYTYLRLDGQTPTGQRQGIVQRFNSPYAHEFVFLLSSKAGGVGLNLIGASRLILYDIDWNPANDLQAMARVWRDGQKKRVFIYRLITTGSLEEKIYQRQISKQGLSGAVVDVKERGDVQFAQEDLKDLFSLNENTSCDTHDLLNCRCENEETSQGGKQEQTTPVSNHRACQLGQTTNPKKSKRNLTMDELLDWRHTIQHPTNYPPEWHLSAAGDSITYLFWNETSGKNSNISSVT